MNFQIKHLVLWPRYGDDDPRTVTFRPGVLNVITGLSKTGKSAIIPIIDYCLGAEKCAIPVQTIRWACEWFGIVVVTDRGELLLARREPGSQKATGDMFLAESATVVAIPRRITAANTQVDRVKQHLDELAGLSRLSFEPEDGAGTAAGFRSRPAFRDLMAFTFQPQSLVANPNVLFYKADTSEHREKLKLILPYVLGAATAEGLALQHERQRLTLELRRKERDVTALRRLSTAWVARLDADVMRARSLGLLPPEASRAEVHDGQRGEGAVVRPPVEVGSAGAGAGDDGERVERVVDLLRTAVEAADRGPMLDAGAVQGASAELVSLQRDESAAALELSMLRRRLTGMDEFRQAARAYDGALVVRRERLGVADYIGRLFTEEHACPMCGTAESVAETTVAALQAALREVEAESDAFSQLPVAFDREEQRVRQDLARKAEDLNAIRVRRRALEVTSPEVHARQYLATNAARFAGYLEGALEQYDGLRRDAPLLADIEALQARLEQITARLSALDAASATRRALKRFAAFAGRILPTLDTERKSDPVDLDIPELTLRITGPEREDFMWEVGSGANWLAYHIATSIALHELFTELPHSPVPSFAVYDQPSQVYFPRGMGAPWTSAAEVAEDASGARTPGPTAGGRTASVIDAPSGRDSAAHDLRALDPASAPARDVGPSPSNPVPGEQLSLLEGDPPEPSVTLPPARGPEGAGSRPPGAEPSDTDSQSTNADAERSAATSSVPRTPDNDASAEDGRDADRRAVRQVFLSLASAAARLDGRWQAIVLDHAAEDVWGSVPGVHLVEEWDGGKKLVPTAWVPRA